MIRKPDTTDVILVFLAVLFIVAIGGFIYQCINYKCIDGHYEMVHHAKPVGDREEYFCEKWILMKEYNSHPEKYPNAHCGCE